MQEQRKENKMGVMPIPRLLMTMSLPIMASMLIQALYNVVDSIFVIRVSEDALTAVSLAFPVQAMIIAISVGTAVGVNAILSRRLGEKNFEDANLTATNGVFLMVLSAAAFALFGIFGVRPFFAAFVEEGSVMRMGMEYTSIVSIFSFGVFISVVGERLVQATGNSIYSMISQMAGALTNIILDPILIFGLLGFPRMEVAGAAIATVVGQFVSMFVIVWFNLKKNPEVDLSFKGFRPNGRIIVEIYRIGLPSIFMQAIGSVMTFGMNKILILFSQTAVSVFGIYFKLQSFIFMPIFGLNSGMIPIIGYNFGARHRRRITHTIQLGSLYALAIMAAGTLIFHLCPGWILDVLFDASDHMLEIGVPALRIISIHFLPAAISIVLSASFQALGKGTYSLIMSACRQLLVLLPSAYLLGRFFSLNALWLSFPIAELASLAIAVVLFRGVYRNEIKPLED
ncbi:putative efflux protein, MATE family [Ruminococcaceae bacterium D5]|nr:putative efflux protein, MATE family [Ruminococcaceae bacterium D5]